MILPGIFSDKQFKITTSITVILCLVYILINIFVVGGNVFVSNLNNIVTIPLPLITAVLAVILWRQTNIGTTGRLLWGGMLIGWVLWAIAETLWAVFFLSVQEVPYPSWADFFWLLGYIPMAVGLFTRVRLLPAKPTSDQQKTIRGVSGITLLLTLVFVFFPVIQQYNPDRLLESVLNLVYALADLSLLILVMYLFFSYGAGDYGFGWRLILLGFILHSISDFVFTYLSWIGWYYPAMKATFLSTMGVDVPYNIAYVLWVIGIYALFILLSEHHTFEIDHQPQLVSNGHILLFTDRDETVIGISRNYYWLFSQKDVTGKPLAQVLRLSPQQQAVIHQKLVTEKKLTDEPITLVDRLGVSQPGWLCGLTTINPQNQYSGATILLRTLVEDTAFDDGLSEYEKSILPYVLDESNSQEQNEIKQLLLDYYLAFIKVLFNLVFDHGGATMSQALLDKLQATALKKDWNLSFNPQNILDYPLIPLHMLKAALPVLLQTTKQFTAQLVDAVTVEEKLREVKIQFSPAVHTCVAEIEKT